MSIPDVGGCYDSSRFPILDDILAVLACNSGDCDQCGYSGSGRKSNCDLVAGPTVCGQNGIINLDDILAVLAAYGGNYYCPACACPEGDFLLGGEEAPSLTPTQVAEVLIDYLRSASPATDLDRRILETMGEALILWCSEEMDDVERAAVVELITSAQGDAADDWAAEVLTVAIAELAG